MFCGKYQNFPKQRPNLINVKLIFLFLLSFIIAGIVSPQFTSLAFAQESPNRTNLGDWKYSDPKNLKYKIDDTGMPGDWTPQKKDEVKNAIRAAFKQWTDATATTAGSTTNAGNLGVMDYPPPGTFSDPSERVVRELTDGEINGLKQLYGNNFDVNYTEETDCTKFANVIVKFVDPHDPDNPNNPNNMPKAGEGRPMYWDSGPYAEGKYGQADQPPHTIYVDRTKSWYATKDTNSDQKINNQDDPPPGGQEDFYGLFKHEIGHDLGLEHSMEGEEIVNTQGGTVSLNDDEVIIEIPPDALRDPSVKITISSPEAGTKQQLMGVFVDQNRVGDIFEIKPHNLQFDKPVRVGFRYPKDKKPEKMDIKRFNPQTNKWEKLPTTQIDKENRIVWIEVTRFSFFSMFEPFPPTGANTSWLAFLGFLAVAAGLLVINKQGLYRFR